jgi:hypothetical protein
MTCTWAVRRSTPPLTGGRASPCVLELPLFDLPWWLIVKNVSPAGVRQCATSGLRVSNHASFAGSIRPGLNLYGISSSGQGEKGARRT